MMGVHFLKLASSAFEGQLDFVLSIDVGHLRSSSTTRKASPLSQPNHHEVDRAGKSECWGGTYSAPAAR